MRIILLNMLLLSAALALRAVPEKAADNPRQTLNEAYALRQQPGRGFDALTLALGAIGRFQALDDADGEAEACYLAGLLLEQRELAAWYRAQYPMTAAAVNPALEFLGRADERFRAAGDWVGAVKTAYAVGNVQRSLGEAALACDAYRLSLSRYTAGQASQRGVAVTILTPDKRDFRESIRAALDRYCA